MAWTLRLTMIGLCLLAVGACSDQGVDPEASPAPVVEVVDTAGSPTPGPTASPEPSPEPPTPEPTAEPPPTPTAFKASIDTPPTPDRQVRKIDRGSGKPAPDFEIELIEGETVTLSGYGGEVVLLNFWGTWCPPCRAEMPALQRTWEEYKDRGVVFLGVAIYDEKADVEKFAEAFGITYPLGVDIQGDLTVDYKVTSFPTTFLIDREGNEVRRIVNPVNEAFLRIFLNGMLKES
jgi:peroxiredoxin